jgi:hypothetical protein
MAVFTDVDATLGIQGSACAVFSSQMKPSLSPRCPEVFRSPVWSLADLIPISFQ